MTFSTVQQFRQVSTLWGLLPSRNRSDFRRAVGVVAILWMLELLALVQLSRIKLDDQPQLGDGVLVAVVLLLLRSIASWLWTLHVSRVALRAENQFARNFLVDFMDSDEERRKEFGTARTVRTFDASVTEAISGALVGIIMLLHDMGLALSLLLGAVVVTPVTGLTILAVMILAAIGYLSFVTSRASKMAHNLEEAAVSSISRLYLMAQNAREIHTMGRSASFISRYLESRNEVSRRRRKLDEIHTSARYYIEVVMFLTIVVFAVATYAFEWNLSLPVALVLGMRVAPAVQRSLADWTRVRASAPALGTLISAPSVDVSKAEAREFASPSGAWTAGTRDVVLDAKGLVYRYPGSQDDVLRAVSLQVAIGDVLVITGDIGTGKSTLLDLLVGVRKPAAGTVTLNGVDAHCLSAQQRTQIGLVPQQVPLMTATWRENVLFGAPEDVGEERIWECLRRVGLAGKVNDLGDALGDGAVHLSGGERQLLGLARVLLTEPTVLFLDEPTSNLDRDSEDLFLGVLAKISGTAAMVLITHRPAPIALATQRLHLGDQLRAREP